MTPVSLSKITPPQLTNTLPRPRLLNLLKKNSDKKLILILGQAAQGKSTLAASFLEQVHNPLSLGEPGTGGVGSGQPFSGHRRSLFNGR